MDETQGQVEVGIETELVDLDGDGVVDAVREVTTTVVDVDGDGVPDLVEQTTTVAYDGDGDGIPDIIETTTITGVDANRDGTIDDDEISVDVSVAIREDLLDEPAPPASRAPGTARRLMVPVAAFGVAAGAVVWWRRRSS